MSRGCIAVGDLWYLFIKIKVILNTNGDSSVGSISKPYFNKCIQYLLMDNNVVNSKDAKVDLEKQIDESEVDYEALCRYTVRIGRGFNAQIQEQQKNDTKKYLELKKMLRKDLIELEDNSSTGRCYSLLWSKASTFISHRSDVYQRITCILSTAGDCECS